VLLGLPVAAGILVVAALEDSALQKSDAVDDEGAEEGGAPPTLLPGEVCDGGPPETLPAPRNPDSPTLPAPRKPRADTIPVPRNPDAPTDPAPPKGDTLPSGPGNGVYDLPIPKPPRLPTF
jgi:hypothetical protein